MNAMTAITADFCVGCPRRRFANGHPSGAVADPASARVYWKGSDAGVTLAEYRVIAALLAARRGFVSYRALYDALKNCPGFQAGHGSRGHESNMRSCIKRIRRKFVRLDPTWDAIENYAGFGYAWREG